MARIKTSSAETSAETQAFVSANADVDYKTIIGVVDALTAHFPDIGFRVPR